MKTLEKQTLLYDEDCPMCRAYTSAFVKTGMLDRNGRKAYSSLSESDTFIDTGRAANEIALVDYENKTVTYGIDSLLKVLGHSFPLIRVTGNIRPVKFMLKKLYSFISYNRKVIMPGREKQNTLQCVPDFNYRYRIAYIIFAILVTATVLYNYSGLITILPKGGFGREMLLALCQLPFQWLFLAKQGRQVVLNYFGNVMTVSLGGSLLLLPVFIAGSILQVPETITLLWFGITVALMFAEHYRRVKLLKLPHVLCYSWAAYRIIALLIILNL